MVKNWYNLYLFYSSFMSFEVFSLLVINFLFVVARHIIDEQRDVAACIELLKDSNDAIKIQVSNLFLTFFLWFCKYPLTFRKIRSNSSLKKQRQRFVNGELQCWLRHFGR